MGKGKNLIGAIALGTVALTTNAQTTATQESAKSKETPVHQLYDAMDERDRWQEKSIEKISPAEWTQYNPVDYGLAANDITAIYFDQSSGTIIGWSLWLIAINNDGSVNGFGPQNSNFPWLSNAYSCRKDGDTLYAGCSNADGLFKQIGDESWVEKFTTSVICSIMKDYQENLRITTDNDGIYIRNGWTTIQHYTMENSPLPANAILKAMEDDQHNMRFATWGGGLAKFDGTNRIIYNGTNTWLGNHFNYLADAKIDKNGILWTWSLKIYRFDMATGQWTEIAKPTRMYEGIKSLDTDQFWNVWITNDQGVALYNPYLHTWTRIGGGEGEPSLEYSNALEVISDETDMDTLKAAIGGNGLQVFKQSTADRLPQFPADSHIDGQTTVQYEHSYSYSLSANADKTVEYERSYTGTGVTLVPNGTSVQAIFGPEATLGDIVCKAKNNFTHPGNDTIQVTLTIQDITQDTTGIETHENAPSLVSYPNPVDELLHVMDMSQKNIVRAQVLGINGQTVIDTPLQPGEDISLSVGNISAGQYILILQDKDGDAYTTKFVKQ